MIDMIPDACHDLFVSCLIKTLLIIKKI